LTKHADEVTLKSHLSLEDSNKIIASTAELVCAEALVVCNGHVKPVEKNAPKVTPVKVRMHPVQSNVGKITHELYDLEADGEPEKKLNVDLDLYQMENY